jgi:hypothetical protein
MATQRDVIGERTHASQSWIRKIGTSTYRFRVTTRPGGAWKIEVDRSVGGRGWHWDPVHRWSGNTEIKTASKTKEPRKAS